MHLRVVWGKIRRGRWDEYKQWYMDNVIPATENAPGLRGRRLSRSVDDPDEGISVTFWNTEADMQAYEHSERRQEISRSAEHLYAGEYWIRHFEIEYSDDK